MAHRPSSGEIRPSIVREEAAARAFADEQHAASTRRAYRSDWLEFEAWCRSRRRKPLPATAKSVAAFIAFEAERGIKASSVARRVAAIRFVHLAANYETPTNAQEVAATLRGLRRRFGTRPQQKAAATNDVLVAMLDVVPNSMLGKRDRALLLIGFAAALRRSELVAIDVEHVQRVRQGVRLHLLGSKTDQERRGEVIAIPRGHGHCPVEALSCWLRAAKIKCGPVFRGVRKNGTVATARISDKTVARVVKKYAQLAGLDPTEYAGHSLRSGFVTSAIMAGANTFRVMDVTRHKRTDTLRGYVRNANEFVDHAGSGLL